MSIKQKHSRLKNIINNLKGVVVAFSGGVDSTFLLKTCVEVLGKNNVIAYIGQAPIFPAYEMEEAKKLAESIDVRYIIEETNIMDIPDFVINDRLRCYYCKKNLLDKAWDTASKNGLQHVVEGSNLDDMDDYRPGHKACIELEVLSPLRMAGLNKKEIRELSKTLLLPTHDKPSFACLSSRIPYGTLIEKKILKKIELSEDFIRNLGIRQTRVRCHNSIARIEVGNEEIGLIIDNRDKIAEALKKYGFLYITLDLQEYRTGSMNIS